MTDNRRLGDHGMLCSVNDRGREAAVCTGHRGWKSLEPVWDEDVEKPETESNFDEQSIEQTDTYAARPAHSREITYIQLPIRIR